MGKAKKAEDDDEGEDDYDWDSAENGREIEN
jgi:hypothetical protein